MAATDRLIVDVAGGSRALQFWRASVHPELNEVIGAAMWSIARDDLIARGVSPQDIRPAAGVGRYWFTWRGTTDFPTCRGGIIYDSIVVVDGL